MSKISTSARLLGLLALSMSSTMLGSQTTMAQTAIPGSADAGRAEQDIQQRMAIPSISPDIQVKDIAAGRAPEGAENIRFRLERLQLDGASAYTQAQLSPVYASDLGKEISLADLYAIAARLTTKYRNDGYILTQIVVPPQTIDSGTARLQVVEGTIDQIIVQAPPGEEKALPLVRAYAQQINSQGRPLNTSDLERSLLLINDLPGISARSIIAPSTSKTGAADLTIIVERDPFDAFVGIDNYGSRFLGRWEATAGASLNSVLFNRNERISGQVVYAPHGPITDHELAYVSGAYWTPVGGYGTNLEVFYSYTDTEPGLDLRDFEVEGKSKYLAITVRHPFIRSRELNLTGRVAFDGRNVESENNIPDNRKDRIRALRVGGRLGAIDDVFSGGVNTLDIELGKGLGVLGASSDDRPNLSRPDGDPEFFKFEAEIQRLQRLTSQFNLLLGVKGQWSNGAQLSSEEFGVGGASYGRGYDPSEIVGDDGVAGKLEVQWNPLWQSQWLTSSQVFGFYDVGKVWNDDSTTSPVDSLASTGLGLRAGLIADMQTEFYVAVPLTRSIQAENDDDARFFMSLSKRF